MTYKIVLAEEARLEIADEALFYKQVSAQLSEDLLNKLYSEFISITENPFLYAAIRGNYRKVNLKRFPFKVVFRIKDDTIVVVAFVHHKRRPFYWQNR